MQGPLHINLVVLAIMSAFNVGCFYLLAKFVFKGRLNIQKVFLDTLCWHTALRIADAIDDAWNWHGDFSDATMIVIVIIAACSGLMSGWICPGEKLVKK